MVGGRVIGLARGKGDTLVHVRDADHGAGADECSIRVIERRKDDGAPVEIRIGDAIWWQGRVALWTPRGVRAAGPGCGETWDIHLAKVGYSH